MRAYGGRRSLPLVWLLIAATMSPPSHVLGGWQKASTCLYGVFKAMVVNWWCRMAWAGMCL